MITSHKTFVVTCDHTSPDGLPDCDVGRNIVEGGWSLHTGERTWNLGDVHHHLRREGWTVGKADLCPDHTGGDA